MQGGVVMRDMAMHPRYGIEKIENRSRVYVYGLPVYYTPRKRTDEMYRIMRESAKREKLLKREMGS
jgi:hypothetical protein